MEKMRQLIQDLASHLTLRKIAKISKTLGMGLNIIQRFNSTELLRTGIVRLSIYAATSYATLLCSYHIRFG